MGHIRTVFAGVLMVAAMVGCNANRPTEQGPAVGDMNSSQTAMMKIKAQFPEAHVGRTTQVLPNRDLAEVTDLPADQMTQGRVLSFMNAELNVLANGVVEEVTANGAFVHFEVADNGRRPVAGDLVIVFPQ